jgi:uncharacterized 2Fe-2S/4Fe-4S cluster protein (DUF4445 family)
MPKLDYEVTFLPDGKRSVVPEDTTLMAAALGSGVDLAFICSGKGYCGKCLVEVLDGKVSPPTKQETRRIPPEKLGQHYRMACQTTVESNVVVRIPDQSRVGRQRLVIMGKEPSVTLCSNVDKVYVEMAPPTLQDPRADDVRFFEALEAKGFRGLRLDSSIAQSLPVLLREGGWKVTATILGKQEVINIQPGDTQKASFGVAVDIGTTKLAVFIVDLTDGALIFADGMMNPQIRFGEDVISRMHYASQGAKELEEVQMTIVGGINELLEKGIEETAIDKQDLYELVAVGNTAMHHLFVGTDVTHLGLSPYPAGLGRPYELKARELGLGISPTGNIYTLGNVAGFVGADAIADALAARLHEKDKLTLLMDVGTNTEVMLGDKTGIWSASTASGPAFEGAHIKCGMRAASGAVERIKIGPDFEVQYKTIEDQSARGICGSGIIDAIAEALKSGLIDTSGKIVLHEHRRLKGEGPNKEFVIAFKEETSTGKEDIVLSQEDIREIQKAKAAMYAGYITMMRKGGFQSADLNEIIIAGAFGSYIDPANARILGMIPEVPLDRISFLGNTAGSGARMCLKSVPSRQVAKGIAEKMRYVELAAEPIFEEEYINAMYMPNSYLERFPETVKMIKAPLTVKHYVRRQA